jgi:hypothetical protein
MKAMVVAAVSVIAITACATPDDGSPLRSGGVAPFNPEKPQVYIVSVGSQVQLVVDQDPLPFARNSGVKKIKWKLHDSDYKLDRVQIQPDAQGNNPSRGCVGDHADDSVFECQNDTSVAGTFKYSIRATPKQSGLPTPAELDPWVMNN